MKRTRTEPLNPSESKDLTAAVYDLTDAGAKQALYGIILALRLAPNLNLERFADIIDDAKKYSRDQNQKKV